LRPIYEGRRALTFAVARLSCYLQISSTVNLFFTGINLLVIVCIVGIGSFYADLTNWTQSPGGFFPFGFAGVSYTHLCFTKLNGSIAEYLFLKRTKYTRTQIVAV